MEGQLQQRIEWERRRRQQQRTVLELHAALLQLEAPQPRQRRAAVESLLKPVEPAAELVAAAGALPRPQHRRVSAQRKRQPRDAQKCHGERRQRQRQRQGERTQRERQEMDGKQTKTKRQRTRTRRQQRKPIRLQLQLLLPQLSSPVPPPQLQCPSLSSSPLVLPSHSPPASARMLQVFDRTPVF